MSAKNLKIHFKDTVAGSELRCNTSKNEQPDSLLTDCCYNYSVHETVVKTCSIHNTNMVLYDENKEVQTRVCNTKTKEDLIMHYSIQINYILVSNKIPA